MWKKLSPRLGSGDLAVYSVVIGLQITFSVLSVLMGNQLSKTQNFLIFVVYPNALAALVFSPVAFFLEKKRRTKLGLRLFAQILCISLGGVSVFQALLYMGMRNTSPPFAMAMVNMEPAIIFVMAWALGMEKVDIKNVRSRLKIGGTVICVCGAMAMSFFHRPSSPYSDSPLQNTSLGVFTQENSHTWIVGCICLVSAVILLSSTIILQAATLNKYPAPLSLAALTTLFGSMEAAILIAIEDKGINKSSWYLDWSGLVTVIYGGMICQGMGVTLHLWCIQKRGPVFVGIFSPVCTVCTAIFSTFVVGNTLNLGSVMGMLLIFGGLNAVLLGKSKDNVDEKVLSSKENQQKKGEPGLPCQENSLAVPLLV